jgi:HSP20 family molecular chaperone IbpA
MSRMQLLASPLLLGFDDLERLIDRAAKLGSDGYPPYNIERLSGVGVGSVNAAGSASTISASNSLGSNGSGSNGSGDAHLIGASSNGAVLRITLAVAGFARDQLDIVIEDRQLVVRGKQFDDKDRVYLHRGIAARQFTKSFVLADGVEVISADLEHGLLSIDLIRREPERRSLRIEISGRS